ncbi:unnamed protein product, partial [Rotaria magnacalcarata]
NSMIELKQGHIADFVERTKGAPSTNTLSVIG